MLLMFQHCKKALVWIRIIYLYQEVLRPSRIDLGDLDSSIKDQKLKMSFIKYLNILYSRRYGDPNHF